MSTMMFFNISARFFITAKNEYVHIFLFGSCQIFIKYKRFSECANKCVKMTPYKLEGYDIKNHILPEHKAKKNMWKRKKENEIQKIKQEMRKSSFNLCYSLLTIAIGTPLLFISRALGLSRNILSPLGFTIENFVESSIATVLIALLIFLFQIATGRSIEHFNYHWKVCNNCNKEKRSISKTCSCGGIFEPIEFYDRF